MILIHDENIGCANIEILQKQIIDSVKRCRKDIDSEKCPSQMINLMETFDLIAELHSQVQDITEMLKIPFDVLVVVERESVKNK